MMKTATQERYPVRGFATEKSGSLSMVFAFCLPIVLMVIGAAIDFGSAFNQRVRLQAHADAVAISGAKALTIAGADLSEVKAATMAYAKAAWRGAGGLKVEINIQNRDSVEVSIEEELHSYFGKLYSYTKSAVQVTSVATIVGATPICVLALDRSIASALSLTGDARLQANGCGAYSNSSSTTGISSYKNSLLEAAVICSAGGAGGGTGNFEPQPIYDCPPLADPLAGRVAPTFGGCAYTNKAVNNFAETLSPGVYCGGLKVTGSAQVSLLPGIYVMKDGPLEVTHTASISGKNVGFYLTGDQSIFLFAGGSSVELSAPTTGEMAGLLFFEDRNAPAGRNHEVVSENARRLVGTIYLPQGNFSVSSKKPVADLSDYTAIIANNVQLHKYPTLVLNANYSATDVPVPEGLTTAGSAVRLSR